MTVRNCPSMNAISRRAFLKGSAAILGMAALKPSGVLAAPFHHLRAGPAKVTLLGEGGPKTEVWSYDGTVPGPLIRARQGERVAVKVTNRLTDPTTVHWHGLRTVNAMDGVPFLTQPPIKPGESFDYQFDTRDAGTFWYHPHVNTAEQVGRGLAGPLIIDEPAQPEVDRDIVWVIDDWRIGDDGQLPPFTSLHDMGHGGRFGNAATINGAAPEPFSVRAGERIRLRLINSANARVFGLTFNGHAPWLMAVDGHPVRPRRIEQGSIILAPGSRADLFLDMNGKPGDAFPIVDNYYPRMTYRLGKIAYRDEPPLRTDALPDPAPLPANPVASPNLAEAERRDLTFQGGAMGGLREAEFMGKRMSLRELVMGHGMFWAHNGVIIPPIKEGDIGKPLFEFKQGRSYILRLTNDTAFDHPMHLHGHSFHVIARNNKALDTPVIQDTVLIQPEQQVDIAFVADNPGDWAFHCHILEHAQAGMMGFVRVA